MSPPVSVSFDTSGLMFQGERDGVRVWHTREGDGIGLHYFPAPPDIDADIQSVNSVRNFCRKESAKSGAAIIEVDTLHIDGCPAVRQIVKVPQEPRGMSYLGSITVPFRDFSYVVKIQCMERGVTGMRDAIVANEKLAAGEVTIDEDGVLRGWMRDPYDPSISEGLARNLSEAEEYDEHFPDHPLSRLRRLLTHIQETLRIDKDVVAQTANDETGRPKGRPWWKIW